MATNRARIVITEDATIFFRRLCHPREVLLRVTKGAIRDGAIRDAVVRAQALVDGGDGAELEFTFVGEVARRRRSPRASFAASSASSCAPRTPAT